MRIHLLLNSLHLGPVPLVRAGGDPCQPVGEDQPPVGEDIPEVGDWQQQGTD